MKKQIERHLQSGIPAVAVVLLLTASTFGAPIPVTGNGSWTTNWPDINTVKVSASGTNGFDGANFFYDSECGFSALLGPSVRANVNPLEGPFGCMSGFATINSISSRRFDVSVDGAEGFLDLFDLTQGTLLAHADLTGYTIVTSLVHTGGPINGNTVGQFAIVSNPEPSTWLLMGAGLGLLAIAGRRAVACSTPAA